MLCVPLKRAIAGEDLEDALAGSSVWSQVLAIDKYKLRTPAMCLDMVK